MPRRNRLGRNLAAVRGQSPLPELAQFDDIADIREDATGTYEVVAGEDGATFRRDIAPPRRVGERRCGFRIAGGVYLQFDVRGHVDAERYPELTQYVMRPEIPVDVQALGISPVGVTMIERNGIHHIIDWVGEQHYATPEEFMDEVLRMGLSRRVPHTLDLGLLCEDSRLMLVHRLGWYSREGPAIFASVPIHSVAIIRDPSAAGLHEQTLNGLRGFDPRHEDRRTTGNIPIRIEDR